VLVPSGQFAIDWVLTTLPEMGTALVRQSASKRGDGGCGGARCDISRTSSDPCVRQSRCWKSIRNTLGVLDADLRSSYDHGKVLAVLAAANREFQGRRAGPLCLSWQDACSNVTAEENKRTSTQCCSISRLPPCGESSTRRGCLSCHPVYAAKNSAHAVLLSVVDGLMRV
jgi:hypothetical protein